MTENFKLTVTITTFVIGINLPEVTVLKQIPDSQQPTWGNMRVIRIG